MCQKNTIKTKLLLKKPRNCEDFDYRLLLYYSIRVYFSKVLIGWLNLFNLS